jgi:hypothetical protein
MKAVSSRVVQRLLLVVICSIYANAQTAASQQSDSNRGLADALRRIDRLEEQNRELMDQIRALRQDILGESKNFASQQNSSASQHKEAATSLPSPKSTQHNEEQNPTLSDPTMDGSQEGEPEVIGEVSYPTEHKKFGAYTPTFGFTVADTEKGSLNVSVYTYFRYLNQLNFSPTYSTAFGGVLPVQRRQDFQLQKVQIKTLGWILTPKLRYFAYAWTSNANMGQGAQVIVAGNLNYTFNDHFTASVGINALPGTRSLEGNFPYWLSVDSRLIADEFFRPSYTSGIWARGTITNKVRYQVMLGNNLSQMGINAAQLPNYPNTFSSAIVWMPTTGEFGPGFGDFDNHEKVATRLGLHFTRSAENKQEQPDTQAFQNTQLRLSDGSIIFTPNLFGPGIIVSDATYWMTSVDGGVKYHGYALEGEYYLRWLNDFKGLGVTHLRDLFDHGFQLQASMMVRPKTVQIYGGGSVIFGQYGTPWDYRIGANWFPWKNRVFRWNTEAQYLFNSPVGYLALPYNVGSKGWVFHSNMELAF